MPALFRRASYFINKNDYEVNEMNPFTLHTKKQGVKYVEHMVFAIGIAYRLWRSVIAFTLHAVFPFLNIKVEVDLESTAAFIEERNNWIESKKSNREYSHAEISDVNTQIFS